MATLSAEEILKYAIKREAEAHKVFHNALDKVQDPTAKTLLKQMASEELKHKEILEKLDLSKLKSLKPEAVKDLKIGEFLTPRELDEFSTFQDVLVYAMKREREAYEFYTTLAKAITDPNAKKLIELLAQQELQHKLDVEAFYDEVVYRED